MKLKKIPTTMCRYNSMQILESNCNFINHTVTSLYSTVETSPLTLLSDLAYLRRRGLMYNYCKYTKKGAVGRGLKAQNTLLEYYAIFIVPSQYIKPRQGPETSVKYVSKDKYGENVHITSSKTSNLNLDFYSK